ncbi:MAG TPA: radical SAM protein [Dissulfurispiraceae bacterium]|nr:radical SAM protein [Dissulfurispiraceae bacterium]
MATKVMFVNAIIPHAEVQNRWPNLGLGYLASSLRAAFGQKQFEIRIVDSNIEKELDSFKPDIVGITSVSQNYNYAKMHARAAKKRGIPVIIGGVHISALPQTMTSDMDYAVLGEGEHTIVELMDQIIAPIGRGRKDFSYINGIAYRNGDGTLHMTPPRPLIEPLDSIPLPARDLLNVRKQSNLFSSRGCPYRCTFCSSSRYWDKVRFFSAEYVVNETREMVERYGVERINFYDDLMIADKKRLERLVDLLKMEPTLSRVKYWMNARANLVTDDTARLLKEMGVVSIGMGLESGNERTLKYLKGGSVSVEDNYNAVKILHKYGIAANASFVIGSPDETADEIMDTYRFISKSGLDFADTFVLFPLPGTPIWDEAVQRGLVSENMDWNRLNVYFLKQKQPILMSNRVSLKDMQSLYRKFKRQRLYIAAKKAWFHPYFKEMVRAGASTVAHKVRRLSWSA